MNTEQHLDSVTAAFAARCQSYIGRVNVTDATLDMLRREFDVTLRQFGLERDADDNVVFVISAKRARAANRYVPSHIPEHYTAHFVFGELHVATDRPCDVKLPMRMTSDWQEPAVAAKPLNEVS